ncbi:AIPR family protein [Crocosphaera sp. XPORK-15E]|uniref:AIPR family protein n=1 Tax=Crocosphaera sp. XPORK-15E TaxID=3110247 RepID=UPI002B1FFD34|nr:AIPR family protein [Crocosphaera sp. XPORK-15E]MEA5536694.1 AIPR family protein [Crocosphaera sp. XPORK-15E]
MDRITEALLKTFKDEQSLEQNIDESVLFEHFANYCIVSKEYNDSFSLDDIHVGGGQDQSIDGIAIIANGNLISSYQEIEDLSQSNKYLDVSFILIQSKRSGNFDFGDIAKFLLGSKDFFDSRNNRLNNNKIENKTEIKEYIYNKCALFKNTNPICKLYYVTTGKWVEDPTLNNKIKSLKETIEDLNIFSVVDFIAIDAKALQTLYRSANNKIAKQINFEKYLPLPQIKNVGEAYIGILSAKEYLKLITDDLGNIIKGLFYDNIRDFQGDDNDVNEEIAETVKSNNEHDAFVLYNNGITIVTETCNLSGTIMTIEDYQIVNGCQTSYVLYHNRDLITDSLCIPIKIIRLKNSEIKNHIIKSNNRQTPVSIEQLKAIEFQKQLEEYYKALPEDRRLYYERRSKQYHGENGIEKIRIVDVTLQMRCFASMFLEQAHNAGRYRTNLLKEIQSKIFQSSHHPIGYYVSCYGLFQLNSLFRKNKIDSKYKPFKYHLLNIFRIQVSGFNKPDLTANQFVKYCEKMEKNLTNEESCVEAFIKSTDIIDQVINDKYEGEYDRAIAKTVSFSNAIKDQLRQNN